MRSSEEGNRVRWRGQPGFFEIWFLVVFDRATARAWWLRCTTFAPARGRPEAARATLWAAAFYARAPTPVVAAKRILPIEAYDPGPADRLDVRMGEVALRNGAWTDEVRDGGHEIAWALSFEPAAREVRRGPWLLERLPLPTRVSHANDGVAVSGWVAVDGVRRALDRAPGVQKHIWGTRRVEELLWLYCPRFEGHLDARLEATAARLRRGTGVPLTTLWARVGDVVVDGCGIVALVRNRIERAGPYRVRWRSASGLSRAVATAWCDPRTLAGWVYRDPAGWEVHAAQSDVASCEVELATRRHVLGAWRPLRLACAEGAALEFHTREPLPAVRYVPWDDGG